MNRIIEWFEFVVVVSFDNVSLCACPACFRLQIADFKIADCRLQMLGLRVFDPTYMYLGTLEYGAGDPTRFDFTLGSDCRRRLLP
jgi:hypothetical protein